MTGSRIVAILAAAVLAAGRPGAAQSPPQPFSFEDVDFTPQCVPNRTFDRLLAVFMPRVPAGAEEAPAVFDEPAFNAVSGDAFHALRLDREAAWHGLRLVEVRLVYGIERGPANYTLVFADDPELVRSVWNARGWNLPPVGEPREIDGRGPDWIGVRDDGALATVTCFHD